MFRQMEKLIELLNEYEEKKGYNKAEWKVSENNQLHYKYVVSDTPNGEGFSEKYLSRDVSQAYLISSRCGFIKWLVENEKIEVTNIWRLPKRLYINTDGITCVDDMCEDCYYNAYESLLMLLSIQDEPIEFLVSILK